jgi:hypothetical protein
MRICVSLFFLLLIIGCYNPERNCQDFRTGTFSYEALVGTEILTTIFVRTDTLEIDYFQNNSDTSSIRWINDCEYIVKKINPKNRAEQKAIHMKILTTQNNTYLFEYNIVGDSQKQKGTAKKIN